MANDHITDTPWLDILPPPAPIDNSLLISLAVLAIVAMLAFTVYTFWQSRPRQRALRQLKKLQNQLDENGIDSRQCLYELNRLLCKGLCLTQLMHISDKNFYQDLSRLQYQANQPETGDTRQLLNEAHRLLRENGR